MYSFWEQFDANKYPLQFLLVEFVFYIVLFLVMTYIVQSVWDHENDANFVLLSWNEFSENQS